MTIMGQFDFFNKKCFAKCENDNDNDDWKKVELKQLIVYKMEQTIK